MTDTIFALATPPGRGAVAVVRVSGPDAGEMLTLLAGSIPEPRRAALRALTSAGGEILDRALVLWFPAPASFTGEDCAEFHLHGGLAVVDGVALALTTGGARLAEPGEFTRRAFENGKLDLDQAEGVADLVDAETASQARQALDQLQGGLGRRYAGWRDALVASLGLLEAAIDFPEEDAASQVARSAEPDLRRLASQLNEALSDAERGRRVREGYRIAIIGAPNSGKSSIINVLVDRDVAIVTPTPGTTRDVIEAAITLSGYRVILADTAGLRHSREVIEAEGIRRAERAAEEAALRLWVVDRADGSEAWMAAEALLRADDICVINKSDLGESAAGCGARRCALERGLDIVNVSARQSDIGALIDLLERRVADALGGSDFPAATRIRHKALLGEAAEAVTRALTRLSQPELAAEDLRLAARAMERVSGRVGAEDVLDRVFSTFCIGK